MKTRKSPEMACKNMLAIVLFTTNPVHAAPPATLRSPSPGPAVSKQSASTPFIFMRAPYPGGELFKAPSVPIEWTVNFQKAASRQTSANSEAKALVSVRIYKDNLKTVQVSEFSDGFKRELWDFKVTCLSSRVGSEIVSYTTSWQEPAEEAMLWASRVVTNWPAMGEIKWIKPENFVSRYQGQESSYLIFAEEQELEDPTAAPPATSTAANAKPSQGAASAASAQTARTAQAAAQQFPPGLIPGVPLKSTIRAALIDETTRLPKRVQFGLETLIYTYETKPENLPIPKKIAALLPPELTNPEKPKAP
jgi:hypothetical protein